VIAFQSIPIPVAGQEPWPWIAALMAGALGFLFVKYDGGKDARAIRCEKREDVILEDNRAQAATIKELSTATLRSVDIAEDAFEMGKMTHDALIAAIARNDASNEYQNKSLQELIANWEFHLHETSDQPKPLRQRRS
jgi:hypothetical protein